MTNNSPFRLFSPEGMPDAPGYSHVAVVTGGKLVYIAGQVPRNASGDLVGAGDFRKQVEQVFANLKAAIEAAGGTFHDIVKLNYYCVDSVDPSQQPVVREVRDRYVNVKHPPASTFVVVRRLVRPEWLIEIEAVAVVRS
jgi:enamine deaminase RidA (YjgF/YER057c/UK114 family)